jgi:hypothetical protein
MPHSKYRPTGLDHGGNHHRLDLDARTLTARRDGFLSVALTRLDA